MKKRILSLVLAFVMVFSLAVPTFAAEANLEVDTLVALGMLEGSGAGITPEYLASEMTRLTAACSVLKLFGKYEEALKFQGTENFADAKDVKWVEGQNVLAYLKANPQFGFTGVTADKFDANAKIDQNSVVKVMLTNLGYVQDVDFAWADVATFAASKGMVIVEGAYNVDALAKNVFSALKVENKVTKTTIAQDLAKDPAKKAILVAAGLIEDEAVELEAVSAEFINLKQVKVVFNKTVDEADAESEANYTVKVDTDTLVKDADLQEDGKTVVLTLEKAAINGSTKNEVKVNVGKEVTFEKLKALDSAFPTVVGVKLTGPKAIEVTFSEPVTVTSTPFSLVDSADKKIGVNSTVSYSANLQVVTLTSLVELKDGEYKLTIAGTDGKKVVDFAGYMVTAQDVAFEAVKDTTAPSVEVVKVEADAKSKPATTTVTIRFNKTMVESSKNVANLNARLGYNAGKDIKVVHTDKTNEYTVTFDTVLAPGTHTMYLVGGTTASTKVKDSWGNVFEDTTLTFEVVLDSEKPVVDSIVTEEDNQFIVTFSEKVAGPKFVIKDAAGKSVTGFSADQSTKNNKKWTIKLKTGDTFKGGVYTVEVKDAKDLSIFENKMDAVTVSVDTTDKVAPTVKTSAVVDGNVRVVFSEAMDESITEKTNWSFDGYKVKSIALSDDAKSVVITFTEKVIIAAPKAITVVNAKDLAGNKVTTALGTELVGKFMVELETKSFNPTKVKLTGSNQVTITYEDNIVENVGDDVYTVTINGEVYTKFESMDVNVVDGTDTVVVLKVDDKDGVTKNISIADTLKVKSTAALTNQYDAKANTKLFVYGDKNDAGKAMFVDEAAPIMLEVTEAIGETDKVIVGFSESLYAGSVQDADFEVNGYKVDAVKTVTNGVEITLDEKLSGGEKLIVKLVGVVEDEERNETTETKETKEFEVKKSDSEIEAEAVKAANAAIKTASDLLLNQTLVVEETNLITVLNAVTGMTETGVTLTNAEIVAENADKASIAADGTITLGAKADTLTVTITVAKAKGTSVTKTITVKVPAIA